MNTTTENPTKVLYIGGSGRSGSTLLERLLAQMSEFTTVGELKHIWVRGFGMNRLCGCGQPFRECDFWHRVFEQAFGDFTVFDIQAAKALGMSVDRIRYIPNMLFSSKHGSYTARARRYGQILRRLYGAIAEVSGRSIVVDASKDPSTAWLLARTPGIDLHIVHLVRDPRAVAFSWQRKKQRPDVIDQVAYLDRHPPLRSAGEWLYRSLLLEAPSSWSGFEKMGRLRYEDLIAEPTANLGRIRHLLGLEPYEFEFLKDGTAQFSISSHTVSGNPMRFQQGPVRLRLDNEWEHSITGADRALVTALTWPLLLKYHYPISRRLTVNN